MKTRNDLIKNWLKKAEKDLLAAEHELANKAPVTESICFHCRQAVEKMLKAYLLFLEIPFSKTHEIGELITKCEEKDKAIAAYKVEADKLTDYAIDIRYPDEFYEPSLDEAKEAHKITLKVKEFILNKVRL